MLHQRYKKFFTVACMQQKYFLNDLLNINKHLYGDIIEHRQIILNAQIQKRR